MKKTALSPALTAAGLSEFEAKVYHTLLHHGKLGVAQITKHSGVKRSTVYLALGALGQQGLVHQTVIGKRNYFVPSPPQKFVRLLEQKQQIINEHLPDLTAIFQAATQEPVVASYYGQAQIQQLYERIQSEALWAKSIFSPVSFYRVFPETASLNFAKAFKHRDADIKSLIPDTPEGRKIVARNVKAGFSRKNKFLPKNYKLSVNSIVWGDKVALISYENLFGVEIQNQAIAAYFEEQFDWWWNNL